MAVLLLNRVEELIRFWNIRVEETHATATAILALGKRNGEPVVLKVFRGLGDEWNSAASDAQAPLLAAIS